MHIFYPMVTEEYVTSPAMASKVIRTRIAFWWILKKKAYGAQ